MGEKTRAVFPGMAELRARMEALRTSSPKTAQARSANTESGEAFLRLVRGSRVQENEAEVKNNVHQTG